MRSRVSSLTSGLPRRARDTVAWETPARWAMSIDVALALLTAVKPLVLPAPTTLPSGGRGVPARHAYVFSRTPNAATARLAPLSLGFGGRTDEYAGDASRPGAGTTGHGPHRVDRRRRCARWLPVRLRYRGHQRRGRSDPRG